ncbi:zinc finger protein 704-like [Liolophura sinensis]|uniref:zinc finger protein 704-like n=1 Tax=Liolophura sinensis TaxID=3198878 RepID=UPI0031588936
MMDDHMAAMVLTSLSVSPVSPVFPQSPSDHLRGESKPFSRAYADSQYSSSFTSGSFLSSTCRSDRSDPSPPLSVPLSGSAPSPSYIGSFPCVDEGIDLEENVRQYFDKATDVVPDKGPKKTMFKCTFPKCGKIFSTCPAVEKHVRGNHLEMKEDSPDLSDHEEEFYYTEIEVNVENVTKTFSDMSTSSSPTSSFEPLKTPISDHDYQRKFHQGQSQGQLQSSSVPGEGAFFGQATSNPIPINMSEVKRSLSWQNSPGFPGQALSPLSRFSRPSPQERLQQHQAQSPKTHTISSSPKSLSQYKKPRSDVRKCRKVYGMENRDMWCTQCKWKKACTRFME